MKPSRQPPPPRRLAMRWTCTSCRASRLSSLRRMSSRDRESLI
jgi:hypothetical protein